MITELKDGQPAYHAHDQAAWRQWLQDHHATQESVWLIIYRKGSGVPSVYYPEAVDEALCFGWIDSKPHKRDGQSYYQFFSRRNPKSAWSKVNKGKVERLLIAGKIAPAGLRMIEFAKQNGMWTHLDAIEEEVMPDDLAAAFAAAPDAFAQFQAFPKSARKGICHWIISAKGAETRAKRVAETVSKAAAGERANAWKPKA